MVEEVLGKESESHMQSWLAILHQKRRIENASEACLTFLSGSLEDASKRSAFQSGEAELNFRKISVLFFWLVKSGQV